MPKTTTTKRPATTTRPRRPTHTHTAVAIGTTCTCLHCGHVWHTVRPRLPKVCPAPACKSRRWMCEPVRPGAATRSTTRTTTKRPAPARLSATCSVKR